jgi:hypothetical protein
LIFFFFLLIINCIQQKFFCLLSGMVFVSSTPITTRLFSSAPLVPNIFLEGGNIDGIIKYTIFKIKALFLRDTGAGLLSIQLIL